MTRKKDLGLLDVKHNGKIQIYNVYKAGNKHFIRAYGKEIEVEKGQYYFETKTDISNFEMEDGTIITEKIAIDPHANYEYYLGKTFVFGTIERFPEEMIRTLYENGYFDIAKES